MSLEEYPKLWEEVSDDTSVQLKTYRLRVPGGFLVTVKDEENAMTNIIFVAEPGHTWPLES